MLNQILIDICIVESYNKLTNRTIHYYLNYFTDKRRNFIGKTIE